MKRLLALALLASGAAAAQTAPFCVVSGTGVQHCFYYSLDTCRSAAATMGGICAANTGRASPSPLPPRQPLKLLGTDQRTPTLTELIRARRERKEQEAMAAAPAATLPVYLCDGDQGLFYSPSPGARCVFLGYVPPPQTMP